MSMRSWIVQSSDREVLNYSAADPDVQVFIHRVSSYWRIYVRRLSDCKTRQLSYNHIVQKSRARAIAESMADSLKNPEYKAQVFR